MRRLDVENPDFETELEALLATKDERDADVANTVSEIIAETRARGDLALAEYTRQFDRVELSPDTLKLSPEEVGEAAEGCDKEVVKALEAAAKRIQAFHEEVKPKNVDYTDKQGVKLGTRWTPVDSAGLYVPGGKAAYPSSVLMNAIPARVAGVKRLVMAVPTPDGVINPAVMAAAQIAHVDEVYRIGGAQAVAAMAYGTGVIKPVDMIVGPGNAYVAEAKRQVFGKVGIDMIAGPSEILVIADKENDPRWIAADLLSQAEHDSDARSVLITDDKEFADKVLRAIEDALATLSRADIARQSLADHGAVITVRFFGEAAQIANKIAPEHLELAVAKPDALMEQITHAGAIFLGRHTPEAIGDYVAGPSHVLPTSGTARFSSGLSVLSFMKKSSVIGCSEKGFKKLAEPTVTLAEAEGLTAHALSVRVRMED